MKRDRKNNFILKPRFLLGFRFDHSAHISLNNKNKKPPDNLQQTGILIIEKELKNKTNQVQFQSSPVRYGKLEHTGPEPLWLINLYLSDSPNQFWVKPQDQLLTP